MLVELFDRFVQLGLERRHLDIEAADVVLPDQPDARLRVGQADSLPEAQNPAPHGRDGLERRMPGVEQLLAGRQKLALGTERVGGLGFLFGGQSLADAKPSEGHPDGGHRGSQAGGGVGSREAAGSSSKVLIYIVSRDCWVGDCRISDPDGTLRCGWQASYRQLAAATRW